MKKTCPRLPLRRVIDVFAKNGSQTRPSDSRTAIFPTGVGRDPPSQRRDEAIAVPLTVRPHILWPLRPIWLNLAD